MAPAPATGPSSWDVSDFNYDSAVNMADAALLQADYGKTVADLVNAAETAPTASPPVQPPPPPLDSSSGASTGAVSRDSDGWPSSDQSKKNTRRGKNLDKRGR